MDGGQKTVFWDFDGTLASAEGLWTRSIHAEILAELPGCGIGIDAVGALNHTGYPWHDPEADYRALTRPGAWWTHMEKHFAGVCRTLGTDGAAAARIAGRVRKRVLDPRNYTLLPGAVEVLSACRARGYANRILSNNMPELREILDALELSPLLDGVLVSADVGWEKPHPAVFRAALESAGNPAVRYMVGDSPAADIDGAKRAGIPAILFRTSPVPSGKQGSEEPDFTCSRLADILDFIP